MRDYLLFVFLLEYCLFLLEFVGVAFSDALLFVGVLE